MVNIMNEVYEKIYELEEYIDSLSIFKKMDDALNNIKNNKELTKKIEAYHQKEDERLKKEIYLDKDFYNYKQLETEVNLLIVRINQKLRKEFNGKGCNL